MEAIGKCKLNPDLIEKSKGKLPRKHTLFPFAILPDGLHKVHYSNSLERFRIFSKEEFKRKFLIYLQPSITTDEHFMILYREPLQVEVSVGEEVQDYVFLIQKGKTEKTIKVPGMTHKSAVNLIRKENKTADLFIYFMDR